MRLPITYILLLTTLVGGPLEAQEQPALYEVQRIRFEGNRTFGRDVLLNVMQTRETPSWFWKSMYYISPKLGERASYFDPVTFEADYVLLKNFYEDNGFFNARIDTSLRFDVGRKRVDIDVGIQEGERTYIDTVLVVGLENLPQKLVEELERGRLVKQGDPFVVSRVFEEVKRSVSIFVNHGYLNVEAPTPTANKYTSTNNVTLKFEFKPGLQYNFGAIVVQHDTTVRERIEDEVVLRHLDFQSGDTYSEQRKINSERNLNRLGVFDRVQIEYLLDRVSDTTVSVPIQINVRARPFHELSPEIGVNDEKNAFNILLGVGYNNRNFFGGARNLSTRLRINLQSLQDWNFKGVFGKTGLRDTSVISSVELSAQMVQPYFLSNKVSLSWTVSGFIEKEPYFFLPILRNRVGIAAQTGTFSRAFLDWNLERVSFSSLSPQLDTARISRLSLDRQPQFNSYLTFTLQRDKRNDLFSPSEGFFHSGTIEEAGLLPAAFGGVFGSDLPYSRYVKLSGVGQWYFDPSKRRTLIWATRVRAGVAQLYGGSPAPVPFPRRFFAGGSGSVRGWKARELGAFADPALGGTALFEGNVEARWHLFRDAGNLWVIELPKLSFVFFYDVGNVWANARSVRAGDLAQAAGLGLRFDTIAGPIRVDFGFRTYDPKAPEGRQWITQRRFWQETFSNGVFHFGVGHAF